MAILRPASEHHRRAFHLACEVVHLRVLLAVGARNQLAGSDACADQRTRLATAEAHLRDLAASTETPMARLAARLELRGPEVEFLWSAVAASTDARLTPHLEALGGSRGLHGMSVALHAELTREEPKVLHDLAIWLARDDNPLVAHGLLIPFGASVVHPALPFRVPARLLSHLRGDDTPERGVARIAPYDGPLHDDDQRRVLGELRAVLAGASSDLVLVIEGQEGSGRRTAAASAHGRPLACVEGASVVGDDLRASLVALRCEAFLGETIPLIADVERLFADEAAVDRFGRVVDSWDGRLVVTTSMPGLDLGTRRPVVRIRWSVPGPAVRREHWMACASHGGAPPSGDLGLLAHRYQVGPGPILRAATSARSMADPASGASVDQLVAGLRHNIAERLGGLAERVEVTQSWDDLFVADDTREQIQTLVARVRHAPKVLETWRFKTRMARGTGVAALFSGPPGTGKTMTASLIARELDLELYLVDLSKVVSKWVGETEKHLARLFDAAEQGHALLLFDEADALFGQRSTEMKGAVDRYANLEVNYLLQRVESFGGITILTTNQETAIDTALKRRLVGHIVFDGPDEDERTLIWSRNLATGAAPLADDLDTAELAHMFPKMSGANIRNAAISAAFLAAADDAPQITMEHLLRAARVEYRAMGHILSERGRGRSGTE